MRVVVEYTVPVLCELDTARGEVMYVRVADDEIQATGQAFDDAGDPLPRPAADRALSLAEAEIWPRWTFGT